MQLIRAISLFVCVMSCVVQESYSRERYLDNDPQHDHAAQPYGFATDADFNERAGNVKREDDGDFQKVMDPVIEVNIIVDRNVVKMHTGQNVVHYVEYLIAKASDILKGKSKRNTGYSISTAIKNVHLLSKPEVNSIRRKRPEETLRNVCRFRVNHARETGNSSDVTLYLTSNVNLEGYPYYASKGNMCTKQKSCGIVLDRGPSTPFAIAEILSDLLDMFEVSSAISTHCYEHNEIPSQEFLGNLLTYTQEECSRHLLENRIRGFGCLADRPKNAITKRHAAIGERYDYNKQCIISFGNRYEADINSKSELEGICNRLLCKHNKKQTLAMTTVLDGTTCGEKSDNKWCQRSVCVHKSALRQPVDGAWGVWGPWSECSKTCGTSIKTRYRRCNNPKPSNDGRQCNPKGFSEFTKCPTEACPPGPMQNDYRTERCQSKYVMLPYQPVQDKLSCYLFCQPTPCGSNHKAFFEYVKDGERCRYNDPYSFCVNGKCIKRGCGYENDTKLLEDKCGVCGGDGTTCAYFNTTISLGPESGIPAPIQRGESNGKGDVWGHLHTIPYGARSVVISESNGYKNLTSKTQIGIQTIDWSANVINTMTCKNSMSRTNNRMVHEGIVWELKVRRHVDVIKSTGPTMSDLHVLVTSVIGSNSNITIEYLKPLQDQ